MIKIQFLGQSLLFMTSRGDFRLQLPKFGDLKEKPLGSVLNILFWNDPQRQIMKQVQNMEHTLLMGDYGTGWCRIIMSFNIRSQFAGKTLILEAAVQSLSMRADTEVVFVMALGETKRKSALLYFI